MAGVTDAALRGFAALLAVGLLFGAVAGRQQRAAHLRELDELLTRSDLGEARPELRQALQRVPDPLRARLGVARGVLALSFDPRPLSALGPRRAMELAARELGRLDLAGELTEQAVRERPLFWQGWMLQGTLTYLRWARTGDPRLFTEQEAWEQPLRTAMSLAPRYHEPRQMLAGALLEIWPALAPEQQGEALEIVRDAFQDPSTFSRLIHGWLRVADREQVFDVIPETPEAWSSVLRSLRAAADWEEYRRVYWHYRRVLQQQVDLELARAEGRLRGGDLRGARSGLLRVIETAPADREFAAAVDRALALLPPGAGDRSRSRGVQDWLTLALDAFAEGSPVLSPGAVARLGRLAGDQAAADAALVELAAGNLAGAELYERRSEALNTEPWAAYCVAKARVLLERGDREGAAGILKLAHRSWRESAPGRALADRLAGEAGIPVDPVPGSIGREGGRTTWPGTEWHWRGSRAFLWLEVPETAAGVRFRVDRAPARGTVAGVYLDRTMAGVEVAVAGEEIALDRPFGAGIHLLEVAPLTGGRVIPGDVKLFFATELILE